MGATSGQGRFDIDVQVVDADGFWCHAGRFGRDDLERAIHYAIYLRDERDAMAVRCMTRSKVLFQSQRSSAPSDASETEISQ